MWDVPFFQGIIFQHKFLNGVWKLIRNSETGYDYCSRTIDYCFRENRPLFSLLFSGIFCNLIIPKQGIEINFFFLNGLWRSLKNGHLPVKLHSSAPPPRGHQSKSKTTTLLLISGLKSTVMLTTMLDTLAAALYLNFFTQDDQLFERSWTCFGYESYSKVINLPRCLYIEFKLF